MNEEPAPPWWAETWERLETRWIRARRTGTVLVEASEGLGGDELTRRLCVALLCLDGAPESPCGCCHACHLAGAGTHPDLHGPTEAGERYGIDELRAWLADLACRPVVSSRTVLWLPAPDRLGLAAASALLKTLEEPPEDAVVVLSARNARTLPPTIVSRAERHRLPYPERASALAWLERARPSGEAHEVWLDLADGAPFLALRYGALVGTRLELLAATVARFFGPPAEALRAAQALQTGAWSAGGKESPTFPGSEAARVVARWVRSALAARHGVESLAVPAPLAAPLQALPTRRLVDLHERARLLARLSGTGANELLAWEALALSCAGTSRSPPTGNRARSRAA